MIIPAIDIINNKIVRLYQGNKQLVKYYDYDVLNLIHEYYLSKVSTIHLVDLDSVFNCRQNRSDFFKNIISKWKNYIQIAGGIRSSKDIEYFLSLGVKRVVIGSSIINQFEQVKKWIQHYGNKYIVIALDVQINTNNIKMVCINGWKQTTNFQLEDILSQLSLINIQHVLCTDISKDGTLSGPNFNLYRDIINQFPKMNFQASGGISTLEDISQLKKIGVSDVIIGKSLLEKKFTILEAIQCWQKESSHVLM